MCLKLKPDMIQTLCLWIIYCYSNQDLAEESDFKLQNNSLSLQASFDLGLKIEACSKG